MAELNAALKDSNVQNIVLEKNFTTDISVNRLVNIDLNNKTLTGNISFSTTQAGNIKLGKGTVTGNLTVDTPNVSFTNEATVSGTTTIKDVANNTFTNNGSLQTVLLQDANGTRFVNGQTGQITNGLTVDTTANVLLEGQFEKVILKQSAKVALKEDAKIVDLNTSDNVQATVTGGTVTGTSGLGKVEIKNVDQQVTYPKVTIKDYVTYKVTKSSVDYYGIQARITLPLEEQKWVGSEDRVVVSLLNNGKVLSTSTSIGKGDTLKTDYFKNDFANEKYYASTLFVPNGKYPSLGWSTTDWKATDVVKPNGLKVEIKRGEKIVSSTISTLALNEKFTDDSSTVALAWETILGKNPSN